MMNFISMWFNSNLDIVFFVYGLAFVVMGLAIWIQPKKGSSFKLADILWLLCLFGLTHGASEWLDMLVIIKGGSYLFDILRFFVLISSFFFFFEFARRIFCLGAKPTFWQQKICRYLTWWLTLALGIIVFILGFISPEPWKNINIWARYLLCFPAGVLSAHGLFLYYKNQEKFLKPLKVRKYFIAASLTFIIYGILSGFIVVKGAPLLSQWINTDLFFKVTYLPVQFFRAVCAIVITWAITGMLKIFTWENFERLQSEIAQRKLTEEALLSAHAELKIKVLIRTQELTVANELLKVEIGQHKRADESLKAAYLKLQQTQDQLIQAEKLYAVGQFASGVAHEVRNPLGIILQGVNYLENKMPVGQESSVEVLGMIKDSVKRADKIVSGLLDFSRITALSLQPEDMNFVLESSISLASSQFKLENIEIVNEAKTDMPRVLVDKNKIEQVFINILLNAIQAMPEGGKIIIRSFVKELGELRKGVGYGHEDSFKIGEKAVIVEFEDTGIGIAEENIKKIFDPFFTTKEPGRGTGLGLSVSLNILNIHKSLIYVESQVGKGTKISIIFKIAQEVINE